jgi:transposase
MIQIAAQIRILVAVEAIDGRKGIDAIAQLCREKLNADVQWFSSSTSL